MSTDQVEYMETRYVVVFVDYLTKYVELIAVANIKATTIASVFVKNIVCRHGSTLYLHSDRGRDRDM